MLSWRLVFVCDFWSCDWDLGPSSLKRIFIDSHSLPPLWSPNWSFNDLNNAIITYILCDLPLFIAIDIFWPLYIIKLRDGHVLAIMDFKTSFPVVEYKYDTWFYSWLKLYNGIFISARVQIPCLYLSSFLEIQGICKSTISMRFQVHLSGLKTYIELCYESCRNSAFSLSESNIRYTLSIMLRYTFAFLVSSIEMGLISISSRSH
jgi:hypothetical protein